MGCSPAPGCLHLTGITPALSPTCREAVLQAIDRAKAHDLAIALDINLRRRLWTDAEAAEVLRPLLASVDVVFGSLEEGIVLGGTSEDAGPRIVAAALIGSGAGHAVLKLGADGAASLELGRDMDGRPGRRPGSRSWIPVGAGDAFCAGYLAGQLEGLDEPDALALGNACGAAVVSVEGDQAGAPTRAEASRIGTGRGGPGHPLAGAQPGTAVAFASSASPAGTGAPARNAETIAAVASKASQNTMWPTSIVRTVSRAPRSRSRADRSAGMT